MTPKVSAASMTTFRTASGETILAERPLRPGEEPTALDRLQSRPDEEAKALVILPFVNAQQAEQFATLVMAQFSADSFQSPIVTAGTAYEYVDGETGEAGQVFELYPEARWESFIKDGDDHHLVLQRVIKAAE